MTKKDEKLISTLKNLPSDFWDFKEDDTHDLVHGIHTYPAVMIYPISRNILKIVKSIREVNTLLDPFIGSGTVAVEGMISGVENIYANDINPLALLLSKVKTTYYDIPKLKFDIENLIKNIEKEYIPFENVIKNINSDLEKKLDLTSKDGWGTNAKELLDEYLNKLNLKLDIPSFKNMGYWFKPNSIIELQIIKNCINKVDDIDNREFIFVAFSETIRLVSNRRNGEFKMYRMTPEKVKKFNPNVYKNFREILFRNLEKEIEFNLKLQKNNVKSKVMVLKENAAIMNSVPNDSVDLIITSPPYGDSRTTVAYGEFSRLSLQWIDLYEMSEKEINGIDKSLMGGTKFRKGYDYKLNSPTLKQSLDIISEVDLERSGDVYSFYNDLEEIIKTCSEKTKKDGYQFWVVGNRTVKNELLKTDVIISEMANKYGMEYIYTIDRIISNKVMPSKNSPTNVVGQTVSTMCNEHIVILKKK